MSEENVEVVRRYVEAAPIGGAAGFWETDGDYYPVRKFPEAKPCHGRDEIASFMSGFYETWGTSRWVAKDIKAIGDDRVLVHGHLEADGRASGMALGGDVFICLWLRQGRIFRQEDHLTPQGALRALGLKGETLEAAGLSE